MPSIRWGLGTGADINVPFTGNSILSGCRLIGAGGADDHIALDWDLRTPGANAVYYVPGTEGVGNAQDTVGASVYDLTPGSWQSGWIGEYALGDTWGRATGVPVPTISVLGNLTVEFWWYRGAAATAITRIYTLASDEGNRWRWGVTVFEEVFPAQLRARVRGTNITVDLTTSLPALGTWTHIAVEKHGNVERLYINGAVAAEKTQAMDAYTQPVSFTGWSNSGRWNGFYGATAAEYQGTAFSPVRYKSAAQNGTVQPYCQCSYAGLAGMVPAQVSWSATAGDLYGKVKRILVNDVSAGWTAVGGAYPTSPVAISGLVLASADALRVELEPKADALQSETPVLDWLHLEYTLPPTGGRVYRPTPVRLGPKLLPIGVLA